jgi:hypothetical protein
MANRIQHRRDTAANWAAANPVLAAGEIGYETGTMQAKTGDGSTAWMSLPYRAVGNPDDVGYDVILLAGQSNMVGQNSGYDTSRLDFSDPNISVYSGSGSYANIISLAAEPLAHQDTASGIGPGLPFARLYAGRLPRNRRVLLVAAGWKGTPFEGLDSAGGNHVWKTTSTDNGNNLYLNAIRQVQSALAAGGPNSRLAAILWLQGESDAINGTSASTYQADLDALIDGFRTQFSNATIPFVIAQMLPEKIDATAAFAAIHAVHAATPTRKAYTAFAYGPYGLNNGDLLHYNAPGQRVNGRNMFEALKYALLNTSAAGATIPVPSTVTGLVVTAPDYQSIKASWTLVPSATSYHVQYKATSSGTWLDTTGTAYDGNTMTITGLSGSTSYDVRIKARNAGGDAAASTTVSATTAAAPVTYAADTFNRADSSSTLGSTTTGSYAWSAVVGTWGISSNAAYDVTATSANHIATIDDTHANGTVAAQLFGSSPVNSGILFRLTDASNFWVWLANGTLYKCVAGSFTSVGSLPLRTPASGDTYSAILNGSSITLKVNGAVYGSATDSFNQSATQHGLLNKGTGNTFDNFSHTDATS